jgi:thiamine-monophosphate kinase
MGENFSEFCGLTMAQIGEDRLVEMIRQMCLATEAVEVVQGIGDDCAVIEHGSRRALLKTDAVVEGVHFLSDTPPARVGAKALKRVLSDLAAAGGCGGKVLVTIGLSADTTVGWVRGVYEGLVATALRFGVAIVGGETVECPSLRMISISAVAETGAGGNVPGRAGAQVGDVICVTGVLGGSFQSEWHLDFEPRLREGRWLVEGGWVTAMMDISDGLSRDLGRLVKRSGFGFRLFAQAIPLRAGADVVGALGDGEDFELLMTVAADRLEALRGAWAAAFPGLALTVVGEVTESGICECVGESGVQDLAQAGWEHFAKTVRTQKRTVDAMACSLQRGEKHYG